MVPWLRFSQEKVELIKVSYNVTLNKFMNFVLRSSQYTNFKSREAIFYDLYKHKIGWYIPSYIGLSCSKLKEMISKLRPWRKFDWDRMKSVARFLKVRFITLWRKKRVIKSNRDLRCQKRFYLRSQWNFWFGTAFYLDIISVCSCHVSFN